MLLPGEKYVVPLAKGLSGNRRRHIDVALTFLYDLAQDQKSLSTLFRASVADGTLEVVLSVAILSFAAAHNYLSNDLQVRSSNNHDA